MDAALLAGMWIVPPDAAGWTMLPGLGLLAGNLDGQGLHCVWRRVQPGYARFQDEERAALHRWLRHGGSRA
ncbi:hypothetical protein [Saccharothrix sp. Mg75]|uniref:hypothetical protein n=1 Tax=Saccharothrix sp. Mg75 TaxID=3445357 RepID=UPI003EECE2CC